MKTLSKDAAKLIQEAVKLEIGRGLDSTEFQKY
jgi:hypothetical protein